MAGTSEGAAKARAAKQTHLVARRPLLVGRRTLAVGTPINPRRWPRWEALERAGRIVPRA